MKSESKRLVIDEKDKLILDCLKEDSRMQIARISEIINIPATTVHNRIKKLKDNGVLNFTISINKNLLYGDIVAYIFIQIREVDQKKVARQLLKHREVEIASIVTGENDLIIRVRVRSIDELNKFILEKLRKIPGINNSTTSIALEFLES